MNPGKDIKKIYMPPEEFNAVQGLTRQTSAGNFLCNSFLIEISISTVFWQFCTCLTEHFLCICYYPLRIKWRKRKQFMFLDEWLDIFLSDAQIKYKVSKSTYNKRAYILNDIYSLFHFGSNMKGRNAFIVYNYTYKIKMISTIHFFWFGNFNGGKL